MNLAAASRASVALSALVVLLATPLAGCRACDSKNGAAVDAAPAVVSEAPVPAPEGLLAEAVLTTPNATWARLQRNLGGAIAILPSTFGGLLSSVASLDLAVGEEVDGAAPAYVALADEPSGTPFAVIAVKVRDARHIRSALADSETARFVASERAGITVLTPKGESGTAVVGLTRTGYMLVAAKASVLERVGPYVHRTLPTRPVPKEALVIDVPRSALTGGVSKRIEGAWNAYRSDKLDQYETLRQVHDGKEPDFGDPPAILAAVGGTIESALAFVRDLDGARLALEAGEGEVTATLELRPSAEQGAAGRAATSIASMRPGDATPLLALPRATALGLVMRDDAAARVDGASTLEAQLVKVLGPRLPADHAKKLHAALEGWAKARGDWMAGSITFADGRGLGARTPTTDSEGADRAVRDGLELLKLPAFREPLRSLVQVKDVAFGTEEVPGLSKVNVARFERAAPSGPKVGAKDGGPERIGVAWRAGDGELLLGLGERPVEHVARVRSQGGDGKLGDDPLVAEAVKRLEDRVTMALLLQPSRLGIAPAGAAGGPPNGSPIVVAWGRRQPNAWGRSEVGYGVLREAMRRVAGF